MTQLPDTNPYRIHLAKMLHNIVDEVPIEKPDIVLIMMHLNTEERIQKFTDWVRTKFNGETLNATADEIVGAALRIHEGRIDLP